MNDMSGRWNRLSTGGKAAVVIGIGILLSNLLAVVIERTLGGGGEPTGPPGSSYTTAPEGLAAFADLLADRGHPVARIRRPLADAAFDPTTTVVIAGDVRFRAADTAAIERFVERGGRIVTIGSGGEGLLEFTGSRLTWSPTGIDEAGPLAPAPENARITTVRGSGVGRWSDPSGLLPVVGRGEDAVIAVGRFGDGRVVAVADQGMLENRLLAEADNAALALDLVGEPGRPVDFAEFHNGYGVSEGLGAIPIRWRQALMGLVIAAIVAMWAWGKRLGPAQDVARDLPPPRVENVHALAASLARTRDHAPIGERLRGAAWARVARRAGLPAAADEDSLRTAARSIGLLPAETETLLRPSVDAGAAIAAGSVLARLEENH